MAETKQEQIKWTDAQNQAITAAGHPILVSAAAGSGKTAVLCERIVGKLLAGENIGDMLIVTFTRAAAAQLRTKLGKKLREALESHPEKEASLRRQLMALPAAKICTIDSFYLDLTRTYFQTLGIGAGVRVLDERDGKELSVKLISETLEEAARSGDAAYRAAVDDLVDTLGGRDPEETFYGYRRLFCKRREGLEALRAAAERLRADAEVPFEKTAAGKVLLDAAAETLREDERLLRAAAPALSDPGYGGYDAQLLYYADFIEELIRVFQSGREAISEKLGLLNPPDARCKRGFVKGPDFDRLKGYRDDAKDDLKNLKKKLFLSYGSEELREYSLRQATLAETLYTVLSRAEIGLQKEKTRLGVLEFDDMARLSLRLLQDENGEPSAAAKELSEHFTSVCIDEYQDTSDLQDAVFSLISPENRFLVGDVKQSIYRFRGACPDVFEHYRRVYLSAEEEGFADAPGELISLSDNFRCDRSVVEFTNIVCGRLFGFSRGIRYRSERDDLIKSKREEDKNLPVRILLSDVSAPAPMTGTTREAEMLAGELQRLLREGRKPGEIAVLTRSLRKHEGALRVALTAAGIPFSIGYDEPMDHKPEILLLHSLLRAGDNPYRDIDLAAAMYSPVFSFTLAEMIAVREREPRGAYIGALRRCAEEQNALGEKCRAVLRFLDDCRALDRILSPDRLLLRLFERYRLLPLLSYSEDPAERDRRRESLLQYYDFARNYAANGRGGLGGFLAAGDRMLQTDSTRDGIGDPNTVRITTVHKSKGLEFPVTVLYGCGATLGGGDNDIKFRSEARVGVAAKLTDPSGFGRITTPDFAACAAVAEREDLDEELRVLYVGMTRAREQLIITGACPEGGPVNPKFADDLLETANAERELSFESLRRKKNYLDWILRCCLTPEGRAVSELVVNGERPVFTEAKTPEIPVKAALPAEEVAAAKAALQERFAYSYPAAISAKLPAKLSVTKLYPDLLDGLSGEDLLRSGDFRAPRFVEEKLSGKAVATAAERGTATHEFMQFCDFAACEKSGVEKELQRLKELRFLPAVTADRVETLPVENFFRSSLYAEMRQAKKIWREQRFNVTLPADRFTKDPEKKKELAGQTLLVQGVIDCFFESADGRIVLLDYKTDRFTEKEKQDIPACEKALRERHGLQLAYYAFALRELLGREADRVLLWSFGLDRAVELTDLPDIEGEL